MHQASLLLSGVPGTGKTTIGDYLKVHAGYRHLNMEADGFRLAFALKADPERFLADLEEGAQPVIATWGFGPYGSRDDVQRLIDAGLAFVWLDGDRVASLRQFLRREGNDSRKEAEYYGQMKDIIITEVTRHLAPAQVCPFRDGVFRPAGDIAADVVAVAANWRKT